MFQGQKAQQARTPDTRLSGACVASLFPARARTVTVCGVQHDTSCGPTAHPPRCGRRKFRLNGGYGCGSSARTLPRPPSSSGTLWARGQASCPWAVGSWGTCSGCARPDPTRGVETAYAQRGAGYRGQPLAPQAPQGYPQCCNHPGTRKPPTAVLPAAAGRAHYPAVTTRAQPLQPAWPHRHAASPSEQPRGPRAANQPASYRPW
jgi:hypothetical protein